jgi:hypothetical protein
LQPARSLGSGLQPRQMSVGGWARHDAAVHSCGQPVGLSPGRLVLRVVVGDRLVPRLSAVGHTFTSMDPPDVVHPADAAINELLGQIADRTRDPARCERIIDMMLTLPPITEWPPEALEQLRDTHEYIRALRRDLEQCQLEWMFQREENRD